MFSQTPSSLLEIKDWTVAREIDTAAAAYILGEELKREVDREKRDREFWRTMFGGEREDSSDVILEDSMSKSALGRGW